MPGAFVKLARSAGDGFLGLGGFAASNLMLLTDGSVICQSERFKSWRRLVPDSTGSYVDGSWTDISDMANDRHYYAAAVLRDGRVVVAGGEYRAGAFGVPVETAVDAGEIYDLVSDRWTALPLPASIRPARGRPGLFARRWTMVGRSNNVQRDRDLRSRDQRLDSRWLQRSQASRLRRGDVEPTSGRIGSRCQYARRADLGAILTRRRHLDNGGYPDRSGR